MTLLIHLSVLFIAKMIDNLFGTAKTILIQRNRCILAGLALTASDFIYFHITRNIIMADSELSILVVSVASGVGCCLAMLVSKRLSKDKTYVNVIMSDNRKAMQDFRDFLAGHHITNVASDSYTLDWNTKTITVTAYAETRKQHMLINDYIETSPLKFKRVIQKG